MKLNRHAPGLAAALACALSALLLGVPSEAQAHPGPLHIDKLQASVVTANGLRWVRVRAMVCVRSPAEASNLAPDEFRLTQFIVYEGRWRPVLIVIKPAPWIVSFGDFWNGKACGVVKYQDPFERPEGFAGFDSKINCFGVAFSIKARVAHNEARDRSVWEPVRA